MKDFICGVLFVGFVFVAFGVCGYIENHYTLDATVIENNKYEIIFEDTKGEWWSWEKDETTENVEIGTKCKLTMSTNFTDRNIYDDEITKITWK